MFGMFINTLNEKRTVLSFLHNFAAAVGQRVQQLRDHTIIEKEKQPLNIFKSSDYPCLVELYSTLISLCSIILLRNTYVSTLQRVKHTPFTAKVLNKC